MQIPDYHINEFLGLNTRIKNPNELKKGEARDSLNWLTGPYKDHIELRMGTALLGLTLRNGIGKVTGLTVGLRNDGTQVPFFTIGKKLMYYNHTDNDTHESGTDLLGTAANGEDVALEPYSNIAGDWVYLSSPNSSIYKVATANPDSPIDFASHTFRGYFKIDNNRMTLWNRIVLATGFKEKTIPNLSYIDKSLLSSYTTHTNEAFGSGNGLTKTFTHTLATGGATITSFGVTVTDGVETFLDDKNGKMVGSLGGTGTVNYDTNIVNVTFNTAPLTGVNNITTTYQIETTSGSIIDFTFSTPRTAGQGDYFPQYASGDLMNVFSFNGIDYCMHQLKTWALFIANPDDTQSTNLPYRTGVGIPYWRGGVATDDGVVYLDFLNQNNPMVRILTLQQYSSNVIPQALSDNLNLSVNGFDAPVMTRWENYYMMSCQKITNSTNDSANDVTYVRNTISGFWDKLDIGASCFAEYNGLLLYGDSISNNVYTLFSGYDDLGETINNYWISNQTDCDVPGIKIANRFGIDGYIGRDQEFDVLLQYDNGNFIKIFTIRGDGPYVDSTQGTLVGSDIVGTAVVGSGATQNAFHFRFEEVIASARFEFVSIMIVANKIGAVQINDMWFKDLRFKGRRVLPIYENTN